MKKALFTVCAGMLSFSAYAQTNCDNAMTQAEMNTCAGQAYVAADKELNAVYKSALRGLPGNRLDGLKKVQKEWIKYRDMSCNWEASVNAGGSIQAMTKSACLTRMTKTRTEELRSIANAASR